MRLTIFALLCLWSWNSARAQQTFLRRYGDVSTIEEARAITRSDDGNFLIVGYRYRNNVRKAMAFKIDPGGNVLWSKVYGAPDLPVDPLTNGEDFYDVIYLDGYYYCVGSTYHFINNPTYNNNKGDVLLVKLEKDGDIVWAKNFGNPNDQSGTLIGNELGLALTPDYLGGVLISARVNSGNATNQNTAFLSVKSNGKVRYAYQFDLSGVLTANEVVNQIWRTDGLHYVVGGWFYNTATGDSRGMLWKLDQDCNVTWSKRIHLTGKYVLSMYSGYFNYLNKKIYTSDFYNPTGNSNIRDINIVTNNDIDGSAPTGTVQAKGLCYTSETNSINNFRSNIFPIGDGAQEFMVSSYDSKAYVPNVTQFAMLTKMSTDLSQPVIWEKKMGFTGCFNKIIDMITCDGANEQMIGVGTVRSNSGYDILVVRLDVNGNSNFCVNPDTKIPRNMTEDVQNFPLVRTSLNTPGCGTNCWADNDFINPNGLIVYDLFLPAAECAASGGGGSGLNLISSISTPLAGGSKLQFTFNKIPQMLSFELSSATGEIKYQTVYTNTAPLITGFNMTPANGYPPGDYKWTIIATYSDEVGYEVHDGDVIIP